MKRNICKEEEERRKIHLLKKHNIHKFSKNRAQIHEHYEYDKKLWAEL